MIHLTREQIADRVSQQEMSMLLNSELSQHQLVPKEYNLDIASGDVNNTFIFSEQDLPGFKSKANEPFNLATANMPARLTRPTYDKPHGKQPADSGKRFQPYKKIPSKDS